MVLNTKHKPEISQAKSVIIIGSTISALQTALTLAQLGVEIHVISDLASIGWANTFGSSADNDTQEQRFFWPLLLQVQSHPSVTLHTNSKVESISKKKENFTVTIEKRPRFINEDVCTACGRCQEECSVTLTSLQDGQNISHHAIHRPILEAKAVTSSYIIDKDGCAPCNIGCPLGINVQGFVSLIANGKSDKALSLITEVAPLAAVLGRVCQHPCEDNCTRASVDAPVSTRALHRFAADNAGSTIKYKHKFPPGSREGKIAIVGSGPAGLTAAWELTRRGYTPTVFESHSVVGGMLATGIPRFRLPREVREREIEAIKQLGVDIRTGITVGRDVSISYLRERGYRAFFLSIGAQQNNKLNIPGEELDGVVDCISLLLTLNLMVDAFVGSNIVVIGDGNAAIDSARTAIRRNKGTVKILSWTIPEEVTAAEEEVEEALQEGVQLEYQTIPVEILGETGKVTGIRCQGARLTADLVPNGRHRPESIPGTDFTIEADHVVVAIGQSPAASQLNLESLKTNSATGVIEVKPLTLESNVPGVFAGGDCITGPSNVLDAVAAGLRAAESIDRYLQGSDLESERSFDLPPAAEVDLNTVEISPFKRATMPTIRPQKRAESFEETTVGLPVNTAQREAQRCLNCAKCSQCLECVSTCELGAVHHDDTVEHFSIRGQAVLRFPSDSEAVTSGSIVDGIHNISLDNAANVADRISSAMALAIETSIAINSERKKNEANIEKSAVNRENEEMGQEPWKSQGDKRIGVFLCRCGESINSVIDYKLIIRRIADNKGVVFVGEVDQACTVKGAEQLAKYTAETTLNRVVLAACRCCNMEQVCYSCTDRRILCQYHMNTHIVLPDNAKVEFVNIREQCAWVHRNDQKGATRKALQFISAGVVRARTAIPSAQREVDPIPVILIIGDSNVCISAAIALVRRDFRVELLSRHDLSDPKLTQLHHEGILVKSWPDSLRLFGPPGNYEASLEYGGRSDHSVAGAVIVDPSTFQYDETSSLIQGNGLLGRLLSRRRDADLPNSSSSELLRELTIKDASGIFMLPDNDQISEDGVQQGLVLAARVSTFLEQAYVRPRNMSVTIDQKLCRGCGDCANLCHYIEMRHRNDDTLYAYIDEALCIGCGVCMTSCPAGAISQLQQSDKQITGVMQSLLRSIIK